jgi:hypothetical protein
MSRVRGPKDRPSSEKRMTFSERAAARRAQNKIDAERRGKKLKEFFKKNPRSPGAQLAERKALKEANRRTMNIGKESKPTRKVARMRGPRDKVRKPSLPIGKVVKLTPSKGATAAITAASVAGKAAGKAAAKPSTAKRAMAGLSEFGKAFAKARREGKKDFRFRDKQYAAITRQEVRKAGASGLGDYLNKLKRTDTKIAKAPGQITKKLGGVITGEQKQRAKERMKARKVAMKGMSKFRSGGFLEQRKTEKMAKELAKAEGLKKLRGSQVSPQEEEKFLKKIDNMSMEELKMLRDSQKMRGMRSGGSVMARGGRMGKQKPTKLY